MIACRKRLKTLDEGHAVAVNATAAGDNALRQTEGHTGASLYGNWRKAAGQRDAANGDKRAAKGGLGGVNGIGEKWIAEYRPYGERPSDCVRPAGGRVRAPGEE